MGTMIQSYKLTEPDFRGDGFDDWPKQLKGANNLLVLTQPQIINESHTEYLRTGADIIETNTFNATRVALADYGLQEYAYEINYAATQN